MGKRLTARQIAGRLNRAKRKGLTPGGLEALRQAALNHRPWEHSTGPRTWHGKKVTRRNAFRTGERADVCLPESFQAYALAVQLYEAGQGNRPPLSMAAEAAEDLAGADLLLHARLCRLVLRVCRTKLRESRS